MNQYFIDLKGGFKSNDSSRVNNIYNTIELVARAFAAKFGLNIWGDGQDIPKKDLNQLGNEAVNQGLTTWKDWKKALEEYQDGININNLGAFLKLLWEGPNK